MAASNKKLTIESPYSRQNFKWLMQNSAAKKYLEEKTINEINKALEAGNDPLLEELYGDILNEYVREEEADLNLAIQESKLIEEFEEDSQMTNKILEQEKEERKAAIEEEEDVQADKILNKLN